MAHEVRWSSRVTEEFIKKGNLNDEQIFLLKTRISGMPISCQADQLGCSTRTVDRMIKELKLIYDHVQKEYPEIFPVRKVSKEEKYMDTH